jgi:hypothetical protein
MTAGYMRETGVMLHRLRAYSRYELCTAALLNISASRTMNPESFKVNVKLAFI